MPNWWLLVLPLLAGAVMPLQAGINGQLAKHLSSVMAAALVSFLVGTLALLIIVLSQREVAGLSAFKGLTWWHWKATLCPHSRAPLLSNANWYRSGVCRC